MTTIVLIAGAFHGGWYFDPVVPALAAAGHRVIAPDLPGMDESHSPETPVNLETHVGFVTRLLEQLRPEPVILVGHSYGGMVITGAAARVPGLISQLIYLDAPVPLDGQRVWDVIPVAAREPFIAACLDGYGVEPPPQLREIEPRVQAQPVATFLQPLDARTERIDMIRTYVIAQRDSSFRETYARLADDSDWECETLPSGHDFAREVPEALAGLLLRRAQTSRAA
jgi:pimeloyl-ACP methyl ester carboxylesterase